MQSSGVYLARYFTISAVSFYLAVALVLYKYSNLLFCGTFLAFTDTWISQADCYFDCPDFPHNLYKQKRYGLRTWHKLIAAFCSCGTYVPRRLSTAAGGLKSCPRSGFARFAHLCPRLRSLSASTKLTWLFGSVRSTHLAQAHRFCLRASHTFALACVR